MPALVVSEDLTADLHAVSSAFAALASGIAV